MNISKDACIGQGHQPKVSTATPGLSHHVVGKMIKLNISD